MGSRKVIRALAPSANPNGIPSQSKSCEARTTLGHCPQNIPNPESFQGVAVRAKANSVRANPDKRASKGEQFQKLNGPYSQCRVRSRAVYSRWRVSGGNGLPNTQFALSPVATRNGLTSPTRIGATRLSELCPPLLARFCSPLKSSRHRKLSGLR